jgi:predicted CxxxxCH...CXXCH cytochrome family protein
MYMKRERLSVVLIILLMTILVISCSDLKKDLPTATSAGPDIHGQGWTDTASGNFHGKAIQMDGWNIAACKQCHGPQYTGGTANVSCEHSSCHADGSGNPKSPESCNTCHGNFLAAGDDTASWAPPKSLSNATSPSIHSVGTHQQHLVSVLMVSGKKVECKECHVVPATVSASGHFGASPAEVVFSGPLASLKTNNGAVVPTPSYDLTSGKCNNSYCHGYFKNGNYSNTPVWNVADGSQKKCGSCHGNPVTGNPLPGGSHPSAPQDFPLALNYCDNCHSTSGFGPIATYDGTTWTIQDKTHHVNGKFSLYDAEYPF